MTSASSERLQSPARLMAEAEEPFGAERLHRRLAELDPDVIVVVAYGKILPEAVLSYPKLGCINVHGSLLPKYRGAAPMQRAIIDGEKVTGITTMYMAAGLDTGDMLIKRELPISPEITAGEYHDALAVLGGEVLLETLDKIKVKFKDSNACCVIIASKGYPQSYEKGFARKRVLRQKR